MKKLILTSLCVLFIAGTVQAALDIDAIVITSCKGYLNGTADSNPWLFEIWVDFVDDSGMERIDVTRPGSSTPFTTIYYEEDEGWSYDSPIDYVSLTALQADYAQGNYTFDFIGAGDTLLNSVTLDYSEIIEPLNPVNFTYPANGATDVPLNPTLTWTVGTGDGDALAMWLDSDDDWYENLLASMDTLSWGPLGPLKPNHTYELEISVINIKDIEPGPALPTMTLSGDEFKYGLWIEYLNEMEFTTIPEPATIALLAFGSLVMLRKKQ
ncbi:MAG: hypothetical protein CVV39_05520 [Planctomycetes bacterium HGW-Planctomycetes-1]|nr:MAG: hypothetical protein CVV39_05520 [Planctomycetes bacterium HGW-Planctomycetes-1]